MLAMTRLVLSISRAASVLRTAGAQIVHTVLLPVSTSNVLLVVWKNTIVWV